MLEDCRRAEKVLSFVPEVLVECKFSWQLPTVYASEYFLVVIATWKLLKKEGRKDNYSLHIMSGLIYQHKKKFFEDWLLETKSRLSIFVVYWT